MATATATAVPSLTSPSQFFDSSDAVPSLSSILYPLSTLASRSRQGSGITKRLECYCPTLCCPSSRLCGPTTEAEAVLVLIPSERMANTPEDPTLPHSPYAAERPPSIGINDPSSLQCTTSPAIFQPFDENEQSGLIHCATAEVDDGSEAIQDTPTAKSLLSKTLSTNATHTPLPKTKITMPISRPTNHDAGIGFLDFAFLPRQVPKPTSYGRQRTHNGRLSVDDQQTELNNTYTGYVPAHLS